jgi:hypothetical protein
MFFQFVNKYTVTLALLIPVILSANIVLFTLWWALTVLVIISDVVAIWRE